MVSQITLTFNSRPKFFSAYISLQNDCLVDVIETYIGESEQTIKFRSNWEYVDTEQYCIIYGCISISIEILAEPSRGRWATYNERYQPFTYSREPTTYYGTTRDIHKLETKKFKHDGEWYG